MMALEKEGVVFIKENGGGPRVQLKTPAKAATILIENLSPENDEQSRALVSEKGLQMARIVEHRNALPNGPVIEVNVRRDAGAESTVIASVNINVFGKDPDPTAFAARMPVHEAFLKALAYAEHAGIAVVWIDDPSGCFPPEKRPVKETGAN